MTQLTEERFEQILADKLTPLATKQDVRDGVEELARMVADGFHDLQERLDVVERVQKLETDMSQIKEALHIRA